MTSCALYKHTAKDESGQYTPKDRFTDAVEDGVK